MMNMIVEQRRQQVVGHTNRVQVTIEVQVDVFHRNHLRVTAAGRTPLHAENRTERGLAQADRHILADVLERVTQAHRGRGFTLTGGSGAHRGHEDHPRAFAHWLL